MGGTLGGRGVGPASPGVGPEAAREPTADKAGPDASGGREARSAMRPSIGATAESPERLPPTTETTPKQPVGRDAAGLGGAAGALEDEAVGPVANAVGGSKHGALTKLSEGEALTEP